jgi:RNA 3'-terminal phosphate cyclase (ATP)
MIEIDGSLGEGGGQVLRSALTLSALTGQPFQITNIRAARSKPGLMPQHLKAVDAAAAISKAQVDGARLDSTKLLFYPNGIRSGVYRFDIGTAGATSLVLQTILLPLCMAGSTSTVMITGGTHVPHAPCYHYVAWQWMEFIKRMGVSADLQMDMAGFYPQGGGRITATIRPIGAKLSPLQLENRGALTHIQGISAVANLNRDIAERQKRQAVQRLQRITSSLHIKIEELHSNTKGTVLALLARFGLPDNGYAQCCYYALGQLGKPAERVADEAVDNLLDFIQSEGAIDPYLADQLLLPLAVASGESTLHTSYISQHLLTNAEVIRMFLPAQIRIAGESGSPGIIHITP